LVAFNFCIKIISSSICSLTQQFLRAEVESWPILSCKP